MKRSGLRKWQGGRGAVQKGDISNGMPPRILIVANDFLVHEPTGWHVDGRRFGRWQRYADRLEIDIPVRTYLHDLVWRRDLRVDVVIIGPPESVAERLQERFNRMNLAISNVYAVPTEQALVDMLAYMPEVLHVVHGRADWTYTFGSKSTLGVAGLRSI